MTGEARMVQCCENCEYWLKISDPMDLKTSKGCCRRFPPQSHAVAGPAGVVMLKSFPVTQDGEWCGEWSAVTDRPAAGRSVIE